MRSHVIALMKQKSATNASGDICKGMDAV